jgi:hypothetical protein
MVVSTIATRLIGPYSANEPGRLKMPTPMMLPTMRAVAWGRPSLEVVAGSLVGGEGIVRMSSLMAHSFEEVTPRSSSFPHRDANDLHELPRPFSELRQEDGERTRTQNEDRGLVPGSS